MHRLIVMVRWVAAVLGLVGFAVACHDDASSVPLAHATTRGAATDEDRTCSQCRPNEVCIEERRDAVTKGHCALVVVPHDVIEPTSARRWREIPNIRDDVLGRLLVVKGIRFVAGTTRETLMECAPGEGDCCNSCNTPTVLEGFGELPVYDPDGEAIGCGGSCCKRQCTPWLPKESEAFDVAGRFESGFGGKEFQPARYFRLAQLPRR